MKTKWIRIRKGKSQRKSEDAKKCNEKDKAMGGGLVFSFVLTYV